ncbi:hypothetical protein ACJX0J_021562, partial [Zea mays]
VVGVVSVISHVSSLRTRGRHAEVMKRTVTIRNARDTGPTVDVVLWGERATAFPAEQIHRDSRSSPQIIVFVGTLVRSYADNVSLSGGSSCKWYINAPLPEVNALRASAETNHNPVIWDQGKAAAESTVIAVPEHKKLKDIKYLHPFENKKKEWLVVVKILKIDRSCIGSPTPRYKISLTAEDDTDTAEFIFFGRMAQRLIKKMWTPSSRLIHPVSFQEKLQIYWKSLSSGINGWWQHASNYTVLTAVVDHTFSRRGRKGCPESTLPSVMGITAEESTALIPAASESKAQKVVAEDLTPVGRDAFQSTLSIFYNRLLLSHFLFFDSPYGVVMLTPWIQASHHFGKFLFASLRQIMFQSPNARRVDSPAVYSGQMAHMSTLSIPIKVVATANAILLHPYLY